MQEQAALVNGADLLEQNDGVLTEAYVVAGQCDVRRQPRLAGLARDGGRNDGRRMLVAGVVLHDQHRTAPALRAAHDRAQVGIANVASFHVRIH